MKTMKLKTTQYIPVDIEVSGKCSLDNFYFADLIGEFHGPDGQVITVPGFYEGDERQTWSVRFSPTATGLWNFSLSSTDIEFDILEGTVLCIENDNPDIHGGLRVDPEYSYHFIHDDGTYRFVMAYECNWLWALAMDEDGENKVREFVQSIKQYGFNEIYMNIYAHKSFWLEEEEKIEHYYGCPKHYAWHGTNEQPDHSRMNPVFFQYYDRVMDILLEEGMNAHLYLKVYNKAVNWPAKYSREEELYFKYVVARYQAYCNVVWDFSKESYNEWDKEYIRSMLSLIKENDGYNRLRTVHDDPIIYNRDRYAELLDFQTMQQHEDFFNAILRQREKRAWPIINSEFGYEHGPGGVKDVTWPVSTTPEDVIYRAYATIMGGGYPTYYYTYTAWDVINYSYHPPGYKYMKILYDFFTSIEWWKLTPNDEVSCWMKIRCLEEPGRQYVFMLTNNIMLNLDIDLDEYTGIWMNTCTGEKVMANLSDKPETNKSGPIIKFNSPIENVPVILYLKCKDDRV